MYAEDTTIYFSTEYFQNYNLAKYITTELDKVHIWLKNITKLSLKCQQTKCMTFSHLSEKKTLNCY